MKQIKLKTNHLYKNSNSYISDYLMSLGILPQDVDSFINQPRNSDEENPFELDNMELAIDTIYKLMQDSNTKPFVQVDSDTDGYTSSSIIINYFKRRWPNIEVKYRLHLGKEHGIITDTVPSDCNLVIIPDAGTNDFKQHKELSEQGKTVIVLDHHEVTDKSLLSSTPAIIINNQLSANFINKNLSGAGVVYKFIKAMDKKYFNDNHIFHDYGDLAAVGIIADAMNMTSLDNNYIAWWGLSHIHNKFLKALAQKQSRGIKNPDHLTKIDVAFYIAPVINGVVRSGTAEDKEIVFRALTDENNQEIFDHEWRGKVTPETLYEMAARIASNAKSRQDAGKKRAFEWLCQEVRLKGLDKHNIIIVTLDEKQSKNVSANITGLIAMELVKEFNKPCLVLRDTTDDSGVRVFGGSARNGNFYLLPDLKAELEKAGIYYAAGHANAFGAFLLPEQVDSIVNYFDTHFDSEIFNDTVYEVDYWFHTGETIDIPMLFDIASYEDLWGNSIPQPKMAFSVNIKSNQVMFMGKDGKSIKIHYDGVDFISFGNEELMNLLKDIDNMGGITHLDIVGRPQINEWMGNQKIQIMIDDFAILQTAVSNSPRDLSNLI